VWDATVRGKAAMLFVRFDTGERATAVIGDFENPGPIQTYVEREVS
jgi:hypothetical protein